MDRDAVRELCRLQESPILVIEDFRAPVTGGAAESSKTLACRVVCAQRLALVIVAQESLAFFTKELLLQNLDVAFKVTASPYRHVVDQPFRSCLQFPQQARRALIRPMSSRAGVQCQSIGHL